MVGGYDAFVGYMQHLANNTVQGLWAIAIVVFFFLVGYLVAWIIGQILKKFFEVIEFERRIKSFKYSEVLGKINISNIITIIVEVYVVLAFLGAALQYINVQFLANIVQQILTYIPSLIQGLIIIVGAVVLGDFFAKVIKGTKEDAFNNMVAFIVQVFTVYLGVVMGLPLILPGVDVSILQTAFTWFVITIAVAIGAGAGIAVGLGLKDAISQSARRHQKLFDQIFGEAEKRVSGKRTNKK